MKKSFTLIALLCVSLMGWADYVDYISLTSTATYTQDFNGIGGQEVTAEEINNAEKKSVGKNINLPDGWKIECNSSGARAIGFFSSASTSTMYVGGYNLQNNAKNGSWNFGATGNPDRAIGGLTTNAENDPKTRSINVMAHLHNNLGAAIKSITLSYDIEKYRYGSNPAGFTVKLYTSTDGASWVSVGNDFTTSYAADANTVGAEIVPIEDATQSISSSFNVTFPANADLYLAWNISVASGTSCNEAQGLAIDEVKITPSTTRIPPTYAVMVSDNGTITENFNCLGGADVTEDDLAAAADDKRSFDRASTLPEGWKIGINSNSSTTRDVTSFADASKSTLYIGGTQLPSTAKNGSWNFGATGSTDRALGGLTTDAASNPNTRGLNVMVHLHNSSRADIETIELSYDIEKYRNGDNANGFTVQLWTSTDGESWSSAGASFCSAFSKDDNSNGFEIVPASTTHVSNALEVDFPEDGELYLAWNISVSSGSTCNKAQGLAIDNVSIRPAATARTTGNGWASFSSDKDLKAPEGVAVYKAIYQNSGSEETLVMTSISSRVIPANTGVLLFGTSGELIKNFAAATSDEVAATDYSDNALLASVEQTPLTEEKDYFCLRYSTEIGSFFQIYQGVYIPAGKAYLKLDKLSGPSSAPGRPIRIVLKEDETTGMAQTECPTEARKALRDGQLVIIRRDAVYTLQGTRIQ